MEIPIIFIHKGYSSYLEYALRQVKFTNTNSEIILLGDDSNNSFPFITHININNYFSKATEFAKIYKHYSTNPYNYEIFCIQRWMILEDYIKSTKYSEVFVCDSDILFYTNITELLNSNFKGIDVGLIGCSAGLSFWKLNHLINLNKLIFESYKEREKEKKEKWENIIKTKEFGGVSDMTLIEEFYKENKNKIKIYDFLTVTNNSYFDANINVSSFHFDREYEFKRGRKQFSWADNTPFCYNHIINKNIKFNCIHFQGPAKYLMAKFYTGEKFRGKFYLDLKFKLLNFLAFHYKTFKIRHRFAFIFKWIQKLKSYKIVLFY